MGAASYIQSSFIGGLVSKWTQGRYHDPHYRTWMETCLNGFPVETESWVRRPGFQLCGPTRLGLPARLIKFDFEESAPYTIEFTDGIMAFWQANVRATTNDSVLLSAISAASPAQITLASPVTWPSLGGIYFTNLGATCPLLQNRRFIGTRVDSTHFTLTDEVTGLPLNGSGIGTPAATATVNHELLIATPYTNGLWSSLRSVQTENVAFLLHSQFPPYELIVASPPMGSNFATFTLEQSFFEDGPYLDPVPGSTATPGAVSGVTSLTLGFQLYSATQAYTIGDFVTSSGIGYESIADANVGNTPAGSPSFWKVVGFGAAINGGHGFVASDIGRLVRMFSEPAAWVSTFTYASGAMVSFNPSMLPGQEVYYSSLTNTNSGKTPGTDAANWALRAIGSTQNPALWTWGKITGLTTAGAISGATGTPIGNMTFQGGLAAAFDGVTNKSFTGCASSMFDGFVGKDFSGPGAESVSQVVIYPSNDRGFGSGGGLGVVTLNLWAKSSAPATANDGTLLGSAVIGDTTAPITIFSNDTVSTWNFIWIEISTNNFCDAAQVIFYNNSASPGTSVNVEILGPPLLYTATAMTTWRLGLYSNTTGWPNVGTYSDGRLWLSSIGYPNRIDACVANGISGVNNGALPGVVNFAPTDQYGIVSDASAIDYTFNAPDANPILWMLPDLQGIIAGTAAGEWLVIAPTAGGLSPLNISARRATVVGCADIEPRRCEHTIVFVQAQLRKLMEYFADVFSGKFSAPNLAKDAKQLTIGNIQEIAYQQELAPIIWARVNNQLVATTYQRITLMTSSGPTMNGWHQHTLGSGRQVESLVVGSATNGTLELPMIITNDPNANVRLVEIASPILDEGSTLAQACYLDEAIAPTSTSIAGVSGSLPYGGLTLNGLWNLNGYTVTAWLGGLDCGDYTVSNGSITVPFGDGVPNGQGTFPVSSGVNRGDQGLFTQAFVTTGITANGVTMFTGTLPAFVGFTYTSQGRIVRPNAPPEAGTRSGPAFGKWRRSEWIMAQFEGSQGVSWGSNFDATLVPVPFRQADSVTDYTVDLQFTGIVRGNPNDEYSFDGMLCWQVTRPYICNVQAIGAALETQDL